MRERMSRGKRTDNGEWVYGSYVEQYGAHEIYLPDGVDSEHGFDRYHVIPKTVGQYTGLTDKNGVKIFEGDIVIGTAYSSECIGVIVWIDEIAAFGVRYRQRLDPTAWENSSILKAVSCGRKDGYAAQVIGNIYDNPELLEGGVDND